MVRLRSDASSSAAEFDAKAAFVARRGNFPAARQRVWDLGCDAGTFSRLAASHGDQVVAMDADPDGR